MLQETLITFPVLKYTTSSKTLSFLLQSLNGTIQILLFGTQKFLLISKIVSFLKFIRSSPSNVFNCNNHKGIRLIRRLRVEMIHLREQKFKHNFRDRLNPIFNCGLDIETTSHFLLLCPTFNDERYTLLSTLNKSDCKLLELTKFSLSQTLLYGNKLFNKAKKHTHS